MSFSMVIGIVAVLATTACTLAGVFLVLRRMAMMADAISHAVLPGLVAGYAAAGGPHPAGAFAGAVVAGLLTVILVELLNRSRCMKEDAAIGIVFSALFALGVFVVSQYYANVHLDTDAVLFGEIAFTPFETWQPGGRDLGPQAIWMLGGLTLLNALFLTLCYKELQLATFDPEFAAVQGFRPGLLHYALMVCVSLTAVGAFVAVGAILAVALMIVPVVTASLLTRRLPVLIGASLGVGAGSALIGCHLALLWDLSIGGMITVVLGGAFVAGLLFSPEQGLLAQALRLRRQQERFAVQMLLIHLANHERTEAEPVECCLQHLHSDLRWSPAWIERVVRQARNAGWVHQQGSALLLTPSGRDQARMLAFL
ncbi:MAG: metal ABC transporter permease [Chloroherpetonaceae bacterium]|nr:metal ABC transporter permease [Chloroherpetonaceae bacterium]